MKAILTLLIACVIAADASAQTASSRTRIKNPSADSSDYSSKGIRFALVKPMLQVEYNSSWIEYSRRRRRAWNETRNSTEAMNAIGLSVGYVSLPIQSLGWTTNLALMDIQEPQNSDSQSSTLARIDGNLAFAFNEFFNLKGGINVSKFTSGEYNSKLNAGFGMQAGIGIQLTKNFGLDLGYVTMENAGQIEDDTDTNVVSKKSGFEIGLNGTF